MKRLLAISVILLSLGSLKATEDPARPNAGFVYGRIRFHLQPYSRFRELPWHHDYPYSDEMFPTFLQRVTTIDTTPKSFEIVDIDSPDLFKYPFTYLCEPGYLNLLPEDVKNLREYLDRGGFIMIDDFRGPRDFANLRNELKKVFPDRDIVPLDVRNPIFHSLYDIDSLDIAPSYGRDPIQFLALTDTKGTIQIIINYNNDLSELWEWLDRGEMPLRDAVTSLQLGANYLVYAMTH